MNQPFYIVHEYYRMYFNRLMELKAEREKQEAEERAKHSGTSAVPANGYANNAATNKTPQASLGPVDMDDLEDMIEEVM